MTQENTLELEIAVLLPGVDDEQDGCLARLESALQNHKGIRRAHLERDQSPVHLCLHYDPDFISVEDVRRIAERAGASIANRYHHVRIPIEGMDCSDCALVVAHSVARMEGVLSAQVSYVSQSLQVEYDSQRLSRRAIEKRISHLGYQVPVEGLRSWYTEHKKLIFNLSAGVLLLIGWAGERYLGFPQPISIGLYLLVYAFAGLDVARHAWSSVRNRHFDTDLLMVVAALGAAILGAFAEGALLLFLFGLGHILEERALDRARRAIRDLADLAPKSARVVRDGQELDLPVDQLQIGDLVYVRPGVRIPVDGEIEHGASAVDQSPVTGESIPIEKAVGDPVFAGSVNGNGALRVRATRLARDSTLTRVIAIVERAQAQKSPTQRTTERFSRIFVPAVLIGDLLLIVVPPFFGIPLADAFRRAMTLLVAASPCALVLGTPAAVLSGLAQAARNGVLIKGGAHLENLGRITRIAFDKTGTLTFGKPRVTDVWSHPGSGLDPAELLTLAAAVERHSAHPLASAVVAAAAESGLDPPEAVRVEAEFGRGLKARIPGKTVWVGHLNMFEEAEINIPQNLAERVQDLEAQGRTTVVIGDDRGPVGVIAIADQIRPEAQESLRSLELLGVWERVMLTGDNQRVAAGIARQLDLTDVRADLLPEQKLTAILELQSIGGAVAMVGDGVNDAPALARATVGIAMGGAGTDVALETADVALMGDDLTRLPFAIGLGRATRAIIRQNLLIALGVISLLMVASILGLAGIGVAILLHEGSTILVVLNALRLLRFHS